MYFHTTQVRRSKNLVVYIVFDLSMRSHVRRTVWCCFDVRRQRRSIRRQMPTTVFQPLIVALVLELFIPYRLSKFGRIPFANPSVGSQAIKQNAELYMMGKNTALILSRLWTKVHEILRKCRGLFIIFNARSQVVYNHVSFRRYSPFNLPLVAKSSKNVEIGSFGSQLLGEGTPQILDMPSQISLTSEHAASFS